MIDEYKIETIKRKKIVYQSNDIYEINYIPNNYVGQTIRGMSIFDSWYQTLKYIYRYGCNNLDEIHEYH